VVVELRVIQPVEQVDGAPTRGRQAAADLAGELGVRGGHERAHLLVPGLDQLRVTLGTIQRTQHGQDAVPGVTVNPVNTPLAEPVEDEISSLRHVTASTVNVG